MVIHRNAYFPGRIPPGAWVSGAPASPAVPAPAPERSLVEEIDAFLARHKMSAGRFGYLVGRPHAFVEELRGGMQVWQRTEDRLREFIRRYDARPDGDWGRGSGMLK